MSTYLRAHNPRPLTPTEAQCPACGRVFANDALCERHKRYVSDGVECQDPAAFGMYEVERRGMKVWRRPPRPAPQSRPRTGAVAS